MVRSGFWNSLGTDVRTYYNTDFSHLMSLMIKDGIHQNYGEHLVVLPGSGLQVVVQTGECWFNECWVRNDADLQISINNAPIVAGYKRIDAIAIKIDATNAVRNGTIEYVAGTPGSSPVAPTLTDTDEIHWHLLAYVTVNANATSITAANIENKIGTTGTPFITGILETIDITTLLGQWSAQFNDWMDENNTEFQTWFQHMKDQLDEDAAAHLQNEIDDLDERLTPFEAAIQNYTNGLGATNIKSIGDGTLTGAISAINTTASQAATAASGKVAKSGDTMSGSLTIQGLNRSLNWQDMNGNNLRRHVWAGFANSAGDFYMWDTTNRKEILSAPSNGAVRLNGIYFRNNNGQAQYSTNGSTWLNFKNPTGTKSITANGSYNITDYASVSVNVPNPSYGTNLLTNEVSGVSIVQAYNCTWSGTSLYVSAVDCGGIVIQNNCGYGRYVIVITDREVESTYQCGLGTANASLPSVISSGAYRDGNNYVSALHAMAVGKVVPNGMKFYFGTQLANPKRDYYILAVIVV